MTRVLGPDFVSIRSATFGARRVSMSASSAFSVPQDRHRVWWRSRPRRFPFAVREPLPGTDLAAGPAGLGVLVSLRLDDAQAPHDQLKAHGMPILTDPFDTPFGRTFVFQDPGGHAIAIHGAM